MTGFCSFFAPICFLARESVAQEESANATDNEYGVGEDDDKTYAAMGVAKTIGTVTIGTRQREEVSDQQTDCVYSRLVTRITISGARSYHSHHHLYARE